MVFLDNHQGLGAELIVFAHGASHVEEGVERLGGDLQPPALLNDPPLTQWASRGSPGMSHPDAQQGEVAVLVDLLDVGRDQSAFFSASAWVEKHCGIVPAFCRGSA